MYDRVSGRLGDVERWDDFSKIPSWEGPVAGKKKRRWGVMIFKNYRLL
jgi:hypothetical protein